MIIPLFSCIGGFFYHKKKKYIFIEIDGCVEIMIMVLLSPIGGSSLINNFEIYRGARNLNYGIIF